MIEIEQPFFPVVGFQTKHMNAAHKPMAQKFLSQHGLQDTLTLNKLNLIVINRQMKILFN